MRLIIIEDDLNKATEISNYIKNNYNDIDIIVKRSYRNGLKEVIENDYDLILLDMSLPTYDITVDEPGGSFRHFAGRDILKEIKRRNIHTKVVVVTQFEILGEGNNQITYKELDMQLLENYNENYFGLIYYNAGISDWMNALDNIIKGCIENN